MLATSAASGYQPLPWDDRDEGSATGSYVQARAATADRYRGPVSQFGTAAVSFDWLVRLDGGLDGIADGAGFTLAIPATLPGWLLYGLLVDPVAVFAPLAAESWSSGLRGEGLRTAPVFDEIAFEFLWSKSSHDSTSLGELEYNRYALGLTLGGPGGLARALRGRLSLGWAWHDLDFDSGRRDELSGPYASLGLELRVPRGRPEEGALSLSMSARWDWARGLDGSGGFLGERAFTAGAGVVFSW